MEAEVRKKGREDVKTQAIARKGMSLRVINRNEGDIREQ